MARSDIFTYGYVVGMLVLSRGDSDDPGRLPDAVAAPNKPIFARLPDQSKVPLPEPESGAHGAFVSHERITTAVIASGPHVGQLTSDVVAPGGAAKPDAIPGVELVVGAYRVTLGPGYPGPFDIEVTEAHTQESPLDLYSALPYVPPPGVPVTTVLLPAGASIGQVLGFTAEGWQAVDAAGGGGGGPGVTDHDDLDGRDDPDQHPVSAITGLSTALTALVDAVEAKQPAGSYATTSDLSGHASDTTAVHGIADTSALVLTSDGRLADARTPTAHKSTHATGGTDALTPADIGAATSGHTHAPPDLSGYVPTSRTVNGKALSDDITLSAADVGASTFSGAYDDLTGKPTLGTAAAAATGDFATAAQGAKADSALQVATAQPINAQTGTTYTLQASDAGKLVTLNNTGAITLNAPGSTFTAGQRVDVLVLNTGMATVVGTSGASGNGTPSLVSRARYSAFTVVWLTATTFVVVGDLA